MTRKLYVYDVTAMNVENKLFSSDENKKSFRVKAKLKWFNAAKGFGFVVPEGENVDAFLHITQLQKLGVHGLGEGAVILCDIDYREKGASVTNLIEIIEMGDVPAGCVAQAAANTDLFKTRGIVKLYLADKGFGFITPDDGMKDIFVHKTCLSQCGIKELSAGQSVRVTFKSAQKGREAISVEIESTI